MPLPVWVPAPSGPIPERVREAVRTRLERHAAAEWVGRCREIIVRFRGAYAYVDAVPSSDSAWAAAPGGDAAIDPPPVRLCRLGYLGSAECWTFAFYKYSDSTYEPSVTFSGSFEASPEEAFDCSAQVYLPV